jgi:hypothetical protein
MHLYAYVQNDPLNLVDLMGLDSSRPSAGFNLVPGAHVTLTAASFCPSICGSAFSLIDSGLYVFEGDWVGAGISAGAAVAGVLTDAGVVKVAALGGIAAADALKGANAIERATIIENAARGAASEARILEEFGLTKNTQAVVSAEGRSVPDALTSTLSVEIKDSAYVSRTPQVRIQTDAARASGRQSVLVTGEETRVTGPASRAFDLIIRRPDLGPR